MNYLETIKQYHPFNEQEKVDQQFMIRFLSEQSDALTRDNGIAHLTVSAWILNQQHNRVLMAYHNIYNSWSWTGGHADGDQDLLAIAIREAQEETGIKTIKPLIPNLFSLEILCVDGHIKHGRYVGSHLHLNVTYLLEANDEEPLTVKPDENKQVGWFSLEEALSAPNEVWMVNMVYRKLMKKVEQYLIDGII